jgi:hypothetical protein
VDSSKYCERKLIGDDGVIADALTDASSRLKMSRHVLVDAEWRQQLLTLLIENLTLSIISISVCN